MLSISLYNNRVQRVEGGGLGKALPATQTHLQLNNYNYSYKNKYRRMLSEWKMATMLENFVNAVNDRETKLFFFSIKNLLRTLNSIRMPPSPLLLDNPLSTQFWSPLLLPYNFSPPFLPFLEDICSMLSIGLRPPTANRRHPHFLTKYLFFIVKLFRHYILLPIHIPLCYLCLLLFNSILGINLLKKKTFTIRSETK